MRGTHCQPSTPTHRCCFLALDASWMGSQSKSGEESDFVGNSLQRFRHTEASWRSNSQPAALPFRCSLISQTRECWNDLQWNYIIVDVNNVNNWKHFYSLALKRIVSSRCRCKCMLGSASRSLLRVEIEAILFANQTIELNRLCGCRQYEWFRTDEWKMIISPFNSMAVWDSFAPHCSSNS